MRSETSVENRFTWIYRENYWGSEETPSGFGSTLSYTENLRKELPRLVERFAVKSILDAPCGDFNWMRQLLPALEVDYVGGDIVKPLVDALSEKYGGDRISFVQIDILRSPLPQADLMICRDCLFHFSYEDTRLFLQNFASSDIKYLLVSTHKNRGEFVNRDIVTGDFRLIDLFAPPYSFPADPLSRIDDWVPPDIEREICLWSREQLAAVSAKFDGGGPGRMLLAD